MLFCLFFSIYPDIDDLDKDCIHLLGYQGENLVACLRLIPADWHPSGNIALGRILTHLNTRGTGTGKALMRETMAYLNKEYPEQKVQMSAQHHLQVFYQSYGFNSIGEPYDEDGIPHIAMLFDPAKENG